VTIDKIFGEIPLAVFYRAIVEPLMRSTTPKRNTLSSENVDVRSFEALLKEKDDNLDDKLFLSDIHPRNYDFMFQKPSLRKFLFNMPDYYLDMASCELSQIIIQSDDPKTSTNLNIEFYSTKPKD